MSVQTSTQSSDLITKFIIFMLVLQEKNLHIILNKNSFFTKTSSSVSKRFSFPSEHVAAQSQQ